MVHSQSQIKKKNRKAAMTTGQKVITGLFAGAVVGGIAYGVSLKKKSTAGGKLMMDLDKVSTDEVIQQKILGIKITTGIKYRGFPNKFFAVCSVKEYVALN